MRRPTPLLDSFLTTIPNRTAGRWTAALFLLAVWSGACSPAGLQVVHRDRLAARADRLDAEVTRSLEAGDVARALTLYPDALAARQELLADDPAALTAYLDTLAAGFYTAPEATTEAWDATESILGLALELRRKSLGENDPAVATTLSDLATLAFERGLWGRSEELERRALGIRRSSLGENDPAVATSLRELGAIYTYQGRYSEAEASFTAALALFERADPPDPLAVADALGSLGEVYRAQGRHREAEERLRRAIELMRQIGETDPAVATALNNLAGLYKDQSRYDEAEPLFARALEIWESDPETGPAGLAIARMNLAELYRLQGRYADARRLAAEALARARKILGPDSPELAWYLDQLALADAELGRTGESEALYREAETLYGEAIALLERAQEPDHPLFAKNLGDLARLLIRSRRYTEAEELYRRALEVNQAVFGPDHPETAVTLTRLARCAALRGDQPAHILEMADRALGILENASAYPEARIDALAVKAETLARQGDLAGARARMAEALAGVEELRPRTGGGEGTRAEFLSRYTGYSGEMVAWQVEAGDPAAALETAERARARVLLDQLAAGRVDLRHGIPEEVLRPLEQELETLDARLTEYRSRIEVARSRPDLSGQERAREIQALEDQLDTFGWEHQRVTQRIRDASPFWRKVVNTGGLPVEALQREVVPPGGWLLLYQIGETKSYLFTVPSLPGRVEAWPLVVPDEAAAVLGTAPGPLTAAALDEVMTSRDGLAAALERKTDPVPDGERTLAVRLHALWQVLVPQGFRESLGRAPEVVIVPDGALHRLPFEALVVAPPRGPIHYWLDDGPVARYAPSATTLYSLGRSGPRQENGRGPAALVVADPVFDRGESSPRVTGSPERDRWTRAGNLERLPGTAREAAAIRATFEGRPGAAAIVLTGLNAEEARVRAGLRERPRYVHFATHGLVEEARNEILAGLALTPPAGPAAAGNDGLLQLFEIYELDLGSDLVVLSACKTQAGRQLEGEGVFALSRGFLAAGARRAVASLWPVDDASTAVLMGDFYRRLAAAETAGREPDYARALRDARLALRRSQEGAAPRFWAPFILSGVR